MGRGNPSPQNTAFLALKLIQPTFVLQRLLIASHREALPFSRSLVGHEACHLCGGPAAPTDVPQPHGAVQRALRDESFGNVDGDRRDGVVEPVLCGQGR